MRLLLIIFAVYLLSGCGDTTHTFEGEVDLVLQVGGLEILIDALMPLALVGMELPVLMEDGETLYCVEGADLCITAGDARSAVSALVEAFENNN